MPIRRKDVVEMSVTMPKTTLARLKDLQQSSGATLKEILKDALRLYEEAVKLSEKHEKDGASVHLVVKNADGSERHSQPIFSISN